LEVNDLYITNLLHISHRAILGNIFEEMNVFYTPAKTVFETNYIYRKYIQMYLDTVLRYSCANDDLRCGVICLHSLLTSSIPASPFSTGSQYFGKLS
jgi:hypothetical protein